MIDSISTATQSTQTNSSSGSSDLDQAAFLRLMTAELQNQDPDSPMDSQAMLDQFATLSNVQAISGLNTMFSNYLSSQDSNSTFTASNMIGKEVSVISGNYSDVQGELRGAIEPPAGVSEVTVSVKDKLGQIIDKQVIDTSGTDVSFPFEFNGVGSGDLTVEATYSDGGVEQSVDVVQPSKVKSVRFEDGQTLLQLASGKFATLDDIRTITG